MIKKEYGVVGCPVSHSMSPDMHNDAFHHLEINANYKPIHVEPSGLENAINMFRAVGLSGFNITIPHKVKVMKYLDGIDELAKEIGAVNTVILQDDKFIGYNTDGLGFLKGIQEEFGILNNKRILLIGAGGASRAIYFTFAKETNCSVDITNRTIEKAEQLKQNCKYNIETNILTLTDAEQSLEKYDMIVNTTQVGMSPEVDDIPIILSNLKQDVIVVDIIYNPLETKFLKNAREQGARIQNGVSMLANQGALAFEIWTGQIPDAKRMEKIIIDKLGGK